MGNCFCHFNGYEVKDAYARKMLSCAPVNVLTLGVKNDGSEDISAIVNEATKSHPLFFPVGVYLVSNPLHIVHGIYGATKAANAGWTEDQYGGKTTFKSSIVSKTAAGAVITSEEFVIVNKGVSNVIDGISIVCNSDEGGILDNGTGTTCISNVSIQNVRESYGICINHSVARAARLDYVNLYASNDAVTNTGIYIRNGTDVPMTNIAVHSFRIGIHVVHGALIYGSNMHIWTAKNGAQYMNDEWWRETTGIIIQSGYGYFNNIYIDCARMVFSLSDANLSVQNLIAWADANVLSGTTTNTGTLVGRGNDNVNVRIRGGIINPHGRYKDLFYMMNAVSVNAVDGFVVMVPNGDNCLSEYYKWVLPCPAYGYSNRYYMNSNNLPGTYHEIARIIKGNGNQKVRCIFSNATEDTVTANRDFTSVTREGTSNIPVYYKVDGDFLRIYTVDKWVTCEITDKCVNFDYIIHEDHKCFVRESLSDITTITAI